MAIRLGDVIIAIRGDTKGLDNDLDQAKGKTTSWASGLAGTLKGALGGAVIGGVTAVVGAVAGIGVAAFNAASDFDAATKKMQSQLGLTEQGAKDYGQTLKNVFANNFGDSIEDVAESIGKVNAAFQRIGGPEGTEQLQQATEDALRLRDAFGAEVNETTSAAVELMDKFGISSKEAFDFLAFGYQQGLDGSGDFLDTIGEYSTQFSNGGASAEQFFSLIQSGMQGGMLGTDKAADAFKEFTIRIQDGSKLTADGLKLLGLNTEKITRDLSTGAAKPIDIFQQVIATLNKIDDPLVRAQAGVALLGTQYEDMGDAAIRALDTTWVSTELVAGATEKLNKQYETIPAFFEGLRRRALVAIEPLGGFLLESFNAALPSIEEWFTKVESWIADFVASSNFEWSPEFKQIKLGDLFEFVRSDGLGLTRIKISDFFDLTLEGSQIQALTLGDFFTFISGEGTQINLADYVTFIYDAATGNVALTLSDVFTFVSDEKATVINLEDYVSFTYDKSSGGVALTLADVFSFVSTDKLTTINLQDYIRFIYKSETGAVKLTITDVFTFDSDEGRTTFNLADYVFFYYEKETKDVILTIPDVFTFAADENGIVINLADYVTFSFATPDGVDTINIADYVKLEFSSAGKLTGLKLGDLFDFPTTGESSINLGDYLSVKINEGKITKLKIGDVIDVESETTSGLFGGALAEASKGLGKALEDAAANLGKALGAPPWLQSLIDWKPSAEAPSWLPTLTGFAFPEAPATISSLLTWTWPDVPDTLSGIGAGLGEALETAASNLGKALGVPSWLQSLIDWKPNSEAPSWLATLTGFKWPETPALLAALLVWTWPDAPAAIADIITWVWPDAPGTIATLLSWTWPGFGPAITGLIDKILAFRWPELSAPAWLDKLTNFTVPAPEWVTRLLNWVAPAPGGFNSDSFDSGGSIGGSSGGGGSGGFGGDGRGLLLQPAVTAGPLVVIEQLIVNNREDADAFAYGLAKRLATR